MEEQKIREATDRIREMEQCFDTLQKASAIQASGIWENPSCREMLRSLTQYYESGQWLSDFELDEQGFLPEDLKRGVLSQDAVFDFLERIRDLNG